MSDQIQATYKYTFPDGHQEVVASEVWRWEAYYTDGTILKQFDDRNGSFHKFAEIDQTKLHIFKMVSPYFNQSYEILFNPETMKLIHFYRNGLLENATMHIRMYCFGYEKLIGGQVEKTLHFIMQNGSIVTTDNDQAVNFG